LPVTTIFCRFTTMAVAGGTGRVSKALRPRLREARKHTGLSLRDYAVLLDVSLRAVERWEAGSRTPTLYQLCRIATLAGLSLTWLLADVDEKRGTIAVG
jgi:transcriptional regulator with XRE-family HTH domain